MANTTKSYLSVISKDEKSKNKAAMETAAKKANLQLQRDLLSLEGQVAEAAMRVENARYAIPFRSDIVIATMEDYNDLNERYEILSGEKQFHGLA